jgi:uncharacterized membrane protein YdjX (TVP38/TMEM64 family)
MTQAPRPAFRQELVSFCVFAAFVVLAWLLGRYSSFGSSSLEQPLSSVPGALRGALFVFLYVTVTFFVWFSKDVFRLMAALMFGPWVSTLLVWLGEMANCAILFRFARTMGSSYVERSLPAKLRTVYEKGSGMGIVPLALLRCAPVFPFRFLDLGAGLSAIPFKRYFAASCIGSPLRIFWLQLVLSLTGTAVFKGPQELVPMLERDPWLIWFSMVYVVFMITALFIMRKRERTWR